MTASGKAGIHGTIRLTLGESIAVFRGTAALSCDRAAHRCAIEARGAQTHGRSRLSVDATITVSGSDDTLLTIEGEFDVAGPFQDAIPAPGAAATAAIAAQFADKLTRLAALPGTPVLDAGAIPMVGLEEFEDSIELQVPAVTASPSRNGGHFWMFMRRLLSIPRSREQF